MSVTPQLVLASTSPFRRSILDKLGFPFECCAPDTDETAQADESAENLVMRLAEAKARSVAGQYRDHPRTLIIGSDQVALLDGKIMGKPGTHENALRQLRAASGKRVEFHTGLCLLNADNGESQCTDEVFSVYFRDLSEQQIEAYLRREQPYNAAGSFKSEALGITLFTQMQGDDPNTLVGLPLIRLNEMLLNQGVDVLTD